MTKEFSPSPWKAMQEDNQWSIIDEDKKVIAILQGKANNKKTASLIAASPYLLEALKAVVDLIGDDDLPDNGELSGAAISDMVRLSLKTAEAKIS